MYSKFLTGLVLSVAALAAQAATQSFEVIFAGEAPVRATLNASGEARAVSQAQVDGEPAVRVTLNSLDAEGKYLALELETRTMSMDHLVSEDAGMSVWLPTIATSVTDVKIKLAVAEKLKVPHSAPATDDELPLVTVSRID